MLMNNNVPTSSIRHINVISIPSTRLALPMLQIWRGDVYARAAKIAARDGGR